MDLGIVVCVVTEREVARTHRHPDKVDTDACHKACEKKRCDEVLLTFQWVEKSQQCSFEGIFRKFQEYVCR